MHDREYDQLFSNTDITKLDHGGLAKVGLCHVPACVSLQRFVAVYASTYMQLEP